MPRSTTNFDTVRKIGLALPGVEESTAYGSPALKVHGKLLAVCRCGVALKIAEGRIRLSPCFLRLFSDLRPPLLRRLDNRRSSSSRQDALLHADNFALPGVA